MRPEHSVISGVNLEVGRGDVCALVGRSGGGKSTIVHLLMRFYDPTRGRILLDGWDLRDLNLKSVHKHMGLVAQETQMFAGSIEENIMYGLSSCNREDMEEAARYANAHDFILRFPEGYATRVGERGVRLSGGQRQRVAIARMLLRRPKVLLLDEATSSLDTESEALVQQALDRLIGEGGRTIVLVAHRLSTVRNADNIAVLDKGALVEQGTHEQLLTKKDGVYEKLVRRQLHKASNPILDDLGAEDTSDNISTLLDDTSSHT
jgi:ABC-type multidrug transport system fused ATPase/permease subunit